MLNRILSFINNYNDEYIKLFYINKEFIKNLSKLVKELIKIKEKKNKKLNKNKEMLLLNEEILNIIKLNIKNKIEKSVKAAKKANCILVFKGPDTIIASPDGKVCINTISTEELAVIGSGDVLSGIIASLIGKNKMSAFNGACAGVWLHSYAARMIKKGLIAEDIIKNLPKALDWLAKKYI